MDALIRRVGDTTVATTSSLPPTWELALGLAAVAAAVYYVHGKMTATHKGGFGRRRNRHRN